MISSLMGKRILRETRELLGELLDEARLRVGDKAYYLPDEVAERVIGELQGEETISMMVRQGEEPEETHIEAVLPAELSDSIKNLSNAEVKMEAALIYAENKSEIDKHRKSAKSTGKLAPVGSWKTGKESPEWIRELYTLQTGERSGAIGKGEILSCFYWTDTSIAAGSTGNTATIDLIIKGTAHSVKASEGSPIYKVNGVKNDFFAKMASKRIGGNALQDLLKSGSDLTQENLLEAIGKDHPGDPSAMANTLKDFLKAADETVKVMVSKSPYSKDYNYLFVSAEGWESVPHNDGRIVFESTTQDKVAIRLLESANTDVRTLSDYALHSNSAVWSKAGKSHAQVFIEVAGGPDVTIGDILSMKAPVRKSFSKFISGKESTFENKEDFEKEIKRIATQLLIIRTPAQGSPQEQDVEDVTVQEIVNFKMTGVSSFSESSRHLDRAKILLESRLLLAELFPRSSQKKSFPRPRIVTELGLSESYITTVLGLPPPLLIEGRVDESYIRLVIREHLIFEAWWDSAKDLLGKGVDWVKEKGESVADVVKSFGENSKGVIAGLWAAATDPESLADLLDKFKKACEKLVNALLAPVKQIVSFFEKLAKKFEEKVRTILDGLEKFSKFLADALSSVASLSGWKGMMAAAAAYLGYKWVSENAGPVVKKTIEMLKGESDPAEDILDSIITGVKESIIDAALEKLKELGTELASSAIESLAGPVAWLKTAIGIFEKADWVIRNLAIPMGLVSAEFSEESTAT